MDSDNSREQWHVAACPNCAGKGTIFYRGYDDYDSGHDKCPSCDGKKLVKIKIDSLREYFP